MIIYQKKIDITVGVDKKSLRLAKNAAKNHRKGSLKKLPFTESNPSWVLLYNHARLGQITPETMRKMRKQDLYFLVGMTFPHPDLQEGDSESREQLTKLQGNVERARVELKRRDFFWTSFFVVCAAFGGAILSGAIALYVKNL